VNCHPEVEARDFFAGSRSLEEEDLRFREGESGVVMEDGLARRSLSPYEGIVPLKAAARQNGAAVFGAPRANFGGSIRLMVGPVGEPLRRRFRIPMRFVPRVGLRPAGAEREACLVSRLEELLVRVAFFGRRGVRVGRVLIGEGAGLANSLNGFEAVRMKVDGLVKSVLENLAFLPGEKRTGSTFSVSRRSESKSSALRLVGLGERVCEIAVLVLVESRLTNRESMM
jgi:hypothetical protein